MFKKFDISFVDGYEIDKIYTFFNEFENLFKGN
jgi:hypothetical protein